MKKSELKQLIQEEIQKVLSENHDDAFNELKKEYFDGSKFDKMIKDERFLALPKDQQKKLAIIIRNNIRQNYY
jgi:hypothetical protein